MSTFEDAWNKTESDIQSVFDLFDEPKQNANVGDFDINNPDKEVSEYEGSFKAWKKAKKAQMKAADDWHRDALEYNRLSKEYSKAENAGDTAKCNLLLSDIQEAAEELEKSEAAYKKAEEETNRAYETMLKEKDEAEIAADKAAENGDTSYTTQVDATNTIASEFATLSDKEISDKIKEAKALVAEAGRNLKHSFEKMESNLSNVGRQGMSAANAAMDPNGAGGTKVLEAGIMGALALSKSTFNAVKSIVASIQKRNATGSVEKLTSVLDERHNFKEESAEEGPELD